MGKRRGFTAHSIALRGASMARAWGAQYLWEIQKTRNGASYFVDD